MKQQPKIIYVNVYRNTINDGDSQTSLLPIFSEGARLYTGYINITNSFSFSLHNVPFSTVFRSRAIAYITEDNFII